MAICRRRRNAPLSRKEVSALKSILFSHGKRNPRRRRARRSKSRALIAYVPRAMIRARKARKSRRRVAKRTHRVLRRRVARRTVRLAVRRHAVKRTRVARRHGFVLRTSAKRGTYRYYAKLTVPEAEGIRIARHQRISVLNAIRKAKRTPRTAFEYLPAAYQRVQVNPAARIGMWLNASEVAGVKAARSSRMKIVAGARFRRSPSALESHDTSYGESYSMDNPRKIIRKGARRYVRITTKRGKKVAEFRIKQARKGRVPARLRKYLFKAGTKRTAAAQRKARVGWLKWRRAQLAKKAKAARSHRKVRRARRVVRRSHKRVARRTVRRTRKVRRTVRRSTKARRTVRRARRSRR